MEHAKQPDLSGLEPAYQVKPTGNLRKVLVVVLVLLSAVQVLRVVDDPSWPNVAVSAGYLLAYGFGVAFWVWRPPAVLIGPEGLRVRRVLRTSAPVPWSQVSQVTVQGRWQDHSTAALRDGRTIPLTGMPAPDAQRLADALAAAAVRNDDEPTGASPS